MVLDITIEVKGVVKAKEKEEATLLLVHDKRMQAKEKVWYLDNGSNNHICGYKEKFMELNESIKGNNPKIFRDFKQVMIKEFEMTDIGLMTYYLGTEIEQGEDRIFVNQEKFAKEILKKLKMEDCAKVNTLVECEVKMSKNDEGENINSTTFKSLVGSLRYLTCTRLDVLFRARLVSRFINTPTITHFKALKQILQYIKGTVDFDLFYAYSNSFELMGYSDSDSAENMDDRKSTIDFVFYIGDITFTWSSNKQPIVTLSTYEAEYVATATCVCHYIWLRRLLIEL
eukprot:XP_024445789.1 uncharacterized protein LOC112324984 [Populus trichocarpa]